MVLPMLVILRLFPILIFGQLIFQISNFLTTFFDNFLTIFWQLFDNFWQIFDNFLTTFFDNFFWQFFDNFLTTFWHRFDIIFDLFYDNFMSNFDFLFFLSSCLFRKGVRPDPTEPTLSKRRGNQSGHAQINLCHYKQSVNEFRHSKLFRKDQNLLLSFQAVLVMPKPTFSFPSHCSRAKINFWHSKPFQAGQNRQLPV
jgi:hypothetical protein